MHVMELVYQTHTLTHFPNSLLHTHTHTHARAHTQTHKPRAPDELRFRRRKWKLSPSALTGSQQKPHTGMLTSIRATGTPPHSTHTHTHTHSHYSQWCTHATINTHSNHAPYQSTFTKLQTFNSITQWTLHNTHVRVFIDPYTHRTLTQTHTHLSINIDYQRTCFFFFNDTNSCISDLTPTFS